MRFLVYDGDAIFLKQLEEKLKKVAGNSKKNEVISVSSREEFIEVFQAREDQLDVIILNVLVKDDNGIHLIRELEDQLNNIQVIFVSDSFQYALDVYEAKHIYFILKDQLDMYLPRALERASELLERKTDMIVLRKKNTSVLVSEREILYCMRRDRVTEIFLVNGEKISVSSKLDELEEKFKSNYMLRCHKSFIVSMRYATTYAREEFILQNDMRIPISRTYIQKCRKQFQEWTDSIKE